MTVTEHRGNVILSELLCLLEDEGPYCVQLHADQALQCSGAVSVIELNLLHQQCPEKLHTQCGQHLLPRCYDVDHVHTCEQWLQQVPTQQHTEHLHSGDNSMKQYFIGRERQDLKVAQQ